MRNDKKDRRVCVCVQFDYMKMVRATFHIRGCHAGPAQFVVKFE